MADEGRSRRNARPSNKAKNALDELRELRRTGAKRIDTYEVKEEAAVYDTVGEDEYADIVAKRREKAGMISSPENELFHDFIESLQSPVIILTHRQIAFLFQYQTLKLCRLHRG